MSVESSKSHEGIIVQAPEHDERSTDADLRCVVQIIGRLSVGGAERHFVDLINNISADQRVAILISEDASGDSLIGQLDENVTVVKLPIRKRYALFGIFRLARALKRLRCQVVHTHMFWPSLYGCVAARIARVPVIVTTEHGENRWKRGIHRMLERSVISLAAARRFCVSATILERRRDRDGVPEGKLRLIANGTSVPDKPAVLWKNEEVVIGTVGRFVIQKNYPLFVQLIGELRRRGHRIRGCIVGDGPEFENIRHCIKEHGLQDTIELPGLDTDTDKWFRYFDLYAITSKEEGLPVSLLEAMSYGLPIVTTDVGAIRTVLRNEREGLLVKSEDLDVIANAVAELLTDTELASEYAAAARQRVKQHYGIDQIAALYEDSYREILSRKTA